MTKNEYKAEAKTVFAGILGAITAGLAGIARVEEEAARKAAVFEVQIGMALDSAKVKFAEAKAEGVTLAKTAGIGTDDWRVYARENLPGKSDQTIYRWQNAGLVAKVLGDSLVPGTAAKALATLYRGLSSVKDDEKAAAEDLVREVYAEAVEAAGTDENGAPIAPTFEDLKDRAEAAFPTNRSGGGGGGGSAVTDESRREAGGPVDPKLVEAALTEGGPKAVLEDLVKRFGPEATLTIGLAVCRLCDEWRPSVTAAVLPVLITTEAAEAADES